MNSEERDVINGIFQRLEQAAQQPRDADAERFIADKIRAQPYAPYAMAQLVYVQEEAIKSLNQQLEQARAEAQRGGQGAPQGSGGGGFFSSIFGGGSRPEPQQPPQRGGGAWGNQGGGYGQQQPGYGAPPQGYPPQQPGYAPQQGGPWGGQPQAPQRSGGGFLATALPMAAGAAGGMLLGSALSNAFAGGHSSLGSMAGLGGAGAAGGTTVENNYFGNQGGSEDFGAPLGGDDAGFQDASYDGDMGDSGNDDWV